MSEDFYPVGVKAPGVDGQFVEWIPGPGTKSNIAPPTQTEAEATVEALASMGGGFVPYESNKQLPPQIAELVPSVVPEGRTLREALGMERK